MGTSGGKSAGEEKVLALANLEIEFHLSSREKGQEISRKN
jgi:hypothetical protein